MEGSDKGKKEKRENRYKESERNNIQHEIKLKKEINEQRNRPRNQLRMKKKERKERKKEKKEKKEMKKINEERKRMKDEMELKKNFKLTLLPLLHNFIIYSFIIFLYR